MSNKQQTLNGSFSLFGKGLHTGLNLTVTFNPAPENHGYKIQRIDLPGEPIIDAIAENVTETQRGTVLTKGEARVSTVEHAMAALFALGIDNCLMQVNGPEFPILDGRAKYYVENNHPAIIDAGTFARVQEEYARRSPKRQREYANGAKTMQVRYSSKYVLTALLICGDCKSPFNRFTWMRNARLQWFPICWLCFAVTTMLSPSSTQEVCIDYGAGQEAGAVKAVNQAL